MRKVVVTVAFAIALAAPASAEAGKTISWEGESSGGGTVSMTVFKTAKGKKKVRSFGIDNVRIYCAPGFNETRAFGTATLRLPVHPRREFTHFVGIGELSSGGYLDLNGRLDRTHASGQFRVYGKPTVLDPPPPDRGCDTGVLDWAAEKIGVERAKKAG